MTFPNTVWNVDELKSNFLPDDLHHLWNILSKNPEKTVKMQSIITDLKMIEGLFPRDIKNIAWYTNIILEDDEPKYEIYENKPEYIGLPNYRYLAYCYLKYGLDGIQIKQIISCNNCNQRKEYIKNIQECSNIANLGEDLFEPCFNFQSNHSINYKDQPGYCIMSCWKCGIFKKISHNTPETIDTFDRCKVALPMHEIVYKREIFCPYENIN
jgi:hypothetical protein